MTVNIEGVEYPTWFVGGALVLTAAVIVAGAWLFIVTSWMLFG